MHIGRNDPCWCGSGIKYKKCHEGFDAKVAQFEKMGVPCIDRKLLKKASDVEKIKESCEINMAVHDIIASRIGPGISTQQIDDWVYEETVRRGGIPAPLNYNGFPKSVCTSINEVVCHGIPSKDIILKEGDIVNIDLSTIYNGYFSDSSRMYEIGEVSEDKKKLVRVTKEAMEKGLEMVKPFTPLINMSQAVYDHVRENGYHVVENIGGHGVGFEFHEEPYVGYTPFVVENVLMVPGMIFTIEPMVNMGTHEVVTDETDGWTVRTADGLPSAQWEIMVLVTEEGNEVLCW